MRHPEFDLQVAVCNYINLQYPNVDFMSDTVANLKLTKQQAGRNKKIQKKGFHCPDLLIFEPKGGYCGLFIELKAKNIYKKDGALYKNDHLDNQQNTINRLKSKGYFACFSIGFDETIKLIDEYMRLS